MALIAEYLCLEDGRIDETSLDWRIEDSFSSYSFVRDEEKGEGLAKDERTGVQGKWVARSQGVEANGLLREEEVFEGSEGSFRLVEKACCSLSRAH